MNEILEALKAKYPGVSDTILKVTANSMAKKGLPVTAVGETNIEQVVTAYGDYRATEAAKTALKGNETKPAETKPVETKPAEEIPAWAKVLADQNAALATELAALKGDKVVTARRGQIDTLIQGLPEKLRAPYKRISLDAMTDEEFTALQGELKTEIEGIAADVKASGTAFVAPPAAAGGSQTNEATAAEAAALIKSM